MTRSPAAPPLRRRLIGGGLWATLGRFVAIGAGFLLSALIARLLAPSEVGVYFLASSVVLVVSIAARLGLDRTASRAVTAALANDEPARARAAVMAALRLGVIASLVVGGAFAAGLGDLIGRLAFDTTGFGPISVWFGAWLAAVAIQGLLAEILRGFHDIRGATIFGGALSGLATVVVLAAVLMGGIGVTLRWTVVATVVATVASAVLAVIAVSRRTLALPTAEVSVSAGELLADSVHVVLGNMAVQVVLWSGLWVVGALAGEADVAIFGAATRLVFLLNTPTNIVNQVLPPIITDMSERGHHGALERVLRASAALATLPSVGIALVFAIAGGPILALLFGPVYREGAPLLSVLALGQVANAWTGSCGMTLLMAGGHRIWMVISVLAAVGSLAACWVGGRLFGPLGVAWALALSTALQQGTTLVAARRKCGVWTHASLRVLWREARRLAAQRKSA